MIKKCDREHVLNSWSQIYIGPTGIRLYIPETHMILFLYYWVHTMQQNDLYRFFAQFAIHLMFKKKVIHTNLFCIKRSFEPFTATSGRQYIKWMIYVKKCKRRKMLLSLLGNHLIQKNGSQKLLAKFFWEIAIIYQLNWLPNLNMFYYFCYNLYLCSAIQNKKGGFLPWKCF